MCHWGGRGEGGEGGGVCSVLKMLVDILNAEETEELKVSDRGEDCHVGP